MSRKNLIKPKSLTDKCQISHRGVHYNEKDKNISYCRFPAKGIL